MTPAADEAQLPPPAGEGAALPRVHGQRLDKLPEDLYIPPDALLVILDAFEGPLDLLLYLIRKQNLDILDIPVARITEQYLQYIGLMQDMRFELAAEYLLMAAWLAEIKSRMLLPRPEAVADDGDPRAELARRLQEYERFRSAAEALDQLPRVDRELFPLQLPLAAKLPPPPLAQPELRELLMAMSEVLRRGDLFTRHRVEREPLSVRERMSRVLDGLRAGPCSLIELLDPQEGRAGVVVSVLAVLELAKLALIRVVQDAPYAPLQLALLATEDADDPAFPAGDALA